MREKGIIVGYFADGPWAHKALEMLINDPKSEVGFVCVRDDNRDPVLIEMANNNDIPNFSLKNINSKESHSKLAKYETDLFVSMSFNQIFKPNTANLSPLGTINCHAGKLPLYKGRNILTWALINDEKEFGITVHYIDEGIDTGDIILQRCFPINDDDTYKSLLEVAYEECANILFDAISHIRVGDQERKTQEGIGFYCSRRIEGDEQINWDQTSRELFNFIRSICAPGVMARAFLNNEMIKINSAKLVEGAPCYKGTPGVVVGIDEYSFTIKTLDSILKITEWESNIKIRLGHRFDLK